MQDAERSTPIQRGRRVLLVNRRSLDGDSSDALTIRSLFSTFRADELFQIFTSGTHGRRHVCGTSIRLGPADLLPHVARGLLGPVPRRSCDSELLPGRTGGAYRTRTLAEMRWARISKAALLACADCLPYTIASDVASRIADFRPDLIYTTGGSIRLVRLAFRLSVLCNVPVVCHFTDDWVSTYCHGLDSRLLNVPRKILERDVRTLLTRSPVALCIGRKMAAEYQERFGIRTEPFMNPVCMPEHPPARSFTNGPLSLVYAGGLYLSRAHALRDVAEAVERATARGLAVSLVIHAPETDLKNYGSMFSAFHSTSLGGTLPGDRLCDHLRRHHVAVHVESFEPGPVKYTRLSLSTKLPQYLGAGLPILAYGPIDNAGCELVGVNRLGIHVEKQSVGALTEAVSTWAREREALTDLSARCLDFARREFEAGVLTNRFRRVLLGVASRAEPSAAPTDRGAGCYATTHAKALCHSRIPI